MTLLSDDPPASLLLSSNLRPPAFLISSILTSPPSSHLLTLSYIHPHRRLAWESFSSSFTFCRKVFATSGACENMRMGSERAQTWSPTLGDFHLYNEEQGEGAGHTKALLAAAPKWPAPKPPSPQTLASPPPLILPQRIGEALSEFSTTTATTPSCCRDSEKDLLLPLPAGMGRRTSSSTPLEAELQTRFEHHDPCDMINELKVIFETHAAVERYEASKQFFGCMMEEGSFVSEHVFAMSGHAKKLIDLGITIPNQLGIHRVLQSLPPSYKNFVMNYNMQNMNKELPELFSMLKSAEIEIKKEHQVLMVNKTTSFKKQGKPKKGNFKKGGKKAPRLQKPKAGPKPDTECYYAMGRGTGSVIAPSTWLI
ncbi:hypothetical protein QYE76_024434 [Lolium multiflorum]|uniref:Uncharacterized protein n=1 Tax=Lolium multiflorum TaxID=4521 RepID=A0AAD8VTA5_LOLMU|nr:hypothetical protein QYE76_024434 [Lolium multiflorum]